LRFLGDGDWLTNRKRKYDYDKITADYVAGLSYSLLSKKYGIGISHAHRVVKKVGVGRSVSEGVLLSCSNQVEWHKLYRLNNSCTRLTSIPFGLLQKFGFARSDELKGKWVVTPEGLLLVLKVDV